MILCGAERQGNLQEPKGCLHIHLGSVTTQQPFPQIENVHLG